MGIPHSRFLSWPDDDQDKALAYTAHKRSQCGHCGTRLQEWEEDTFAYIGHQWRCPGCEVLAQERENVDDKEKGVQIGLVPRRLSEQIDEAERLAEEEERRRRDAADTDTDT